MIRYMAQEALMKRKQIDNGGIDRRGFLSAAGAVGASTLLGAWTGRAEAQSEPSGDLVVCVAGGA